MRTFTVCREDFHSTPYGSPSDSQKYIISHHTVYSWKLRRWIFYSYSPRRGRCPGGVKVGGPGRALVAHRQSNLDCERISRGTESTLKIIFSPTSAPARSSSNTKQLVLAPSIACLHLRLSQFQPALTYPHSRPLMLHHHPRLCKPMSTPSPACPSASATAHHPRRQVAAQAVRAPLADKLVIPPITSVLGDEPE